MPSTLLVSIPAVLQKYDRYFDYYSMDIICGIATVTFEGTKADSVDGQRRMKRLRRLYELEDESSAWANVLYPILHRLVPAFDGNPDTDFGSTSCTIKRRIAGRTTSAAG